MGHTTELPKINELGFYEMHFESVGGLGRQPCWANPGPDFGAGPLGR